MVPGPPTVPAAGQPKISAERLAQQHEAWPVAAADVRPAYRTPGAPESTIEWSSGWQGHGDFTTTPGRHRVMTSQRRERSATRTDAKTTMRISPTASIPRSFAKPR